MRIIDETGNEYGDLIITGPSPSKSGRAYWEAACKCGKVIPVRGRELRAGAKTDCGCKATPKATQTAQAPTALPQDLADRLAALEAFMAKFDPRKGYNPGRSKEDELWEGIDFVQKESKAADKELDKRLTTLERIVGTMPKPGQVVDNTLTWPDLANPLPFKSIPGMTPAEGIAIATQFLKLPYKERQNTSKEMKEWLRIHLLPEHEDFTRILDFSPGQEEGAAAVERCNTWRAMQKQIQSYDQDIHPDDL